MGILHGLHGVVSVVMDRVPLVLCVGVAKAGNVDHITVVESNEHSEDARCRMHWLLALRVQGDAEQSVCRLVQKVGVQHSDFTHVTQPDLGRGLPESFPDPLLIIEDLFEPAKILLLERHQDHEGCRLVVQSGVVRGRLGVEEPHGGLVSHVLLIAPHWGIVQPNDHIIFVDDASQGAIFNGKAVAYDDTGPAFKVFNVGWHLVICNKSKNFQQQQLAALNAIR